MSKLYYVIGPSGAGKDSLLIAARRRVAGQPVLFAHRYITRPADVGGENFISLSNAEFELRRKARLFCFLWQSHGLDYGIGVEVFEWLAQGMSVVMNGSRAYLPQAKAVADEAGIVFVPIWIHCDLSILAQRLAARGRESLEDIAERLERAKQYTPPDSAIVINNATDFDSALESLLTVITT